MRSTTPLSFCLRLKARIQPSHQFNRLIKRKDGLIYHRCVFQTSVVSGPGTGGRAWIEAHGSSVAINNRLSQSVPHLHIHVVPRRRKDGLKGFFEPHRPYNDSASIIAVLQALRVTSAQVQAVQPS
jgi:hypothetical protein